jgi:hypothetical protein
LFIDKALTQHGMYRFMLQLVKKRAALIQSLQQAIIWLMMNRFVILLALMLLMIFISGTVGCAGETTPTITPTNTLLQTPAPTPMVTEMPVATSTSTPEPTYKPTFTPITTPALPQPPTVSPTPSPCCHDNFDCDFTQYCAKAVNNCSGCGSCQTRPSACTQVYDPVCGCDGNTYKNAGCAAAAGVNVMSPGECRFWIPLP